MLTVDVWDTLLRRDCHPDVIKISSWQRIALLQCWPLHNMSPESLLAARRRMESEIAQDSVALGFDDEYRLRDVILRSGLSPTDCIAQHEFELSEEYRRTRADATIRRRLKRQGRMDVSLVSDFYMDREALLGLVQAKLPWLQVRDVYVSCDFGLNKRSGRLYRVVSKTEPWEHLGDNPWSDVHQARAEGARARLYRPIVEEVRRKAARRRFSRRHTPAKRQPRGTLSDVAVGLVGFAEWLRSHSLSHGAPILFLEREGLTLKRIFDQVEAANVWELPRVESRSIAVSRISTFGPAFHNDPYRSLQRLVSQYEQLSWQQLLVTLGISSASLRDLEIDYSGRGLVRRILADPALLSTLTAGLESSFVAAREYLSQEIPESRAVLSDVGWSGSIQANITSILPEKRFQGSYLALRPNPQSGVAVSSYLDSHLGDNYWKIIRCVRPLEMLFNAPVASVLRYELRDSQVLVSRHGVADCQSDTWTALQTRVLGELEVAVDVVRRDGLTIVECAERLAAGLAHVLTRPPRSLTRGYLAAVHDESYGLGRVVDIGCRPFSPSQITRALLSRDSDALRQMYWHYGWPEAMLRDQIRFLPPTWLRRLAGRYVGL